MSDSPTVSLFIQCLVDSMYPDTGEAMVKVLRRLGVQLTYPQDQTCCGQPAYNSGFRKEASAAARRFIDIFENAEAVVCPSGSCVHMVRHHYPHLLKEDPDYLKRAQLLAEKTFEFTEYLVTVLGVTRLPARFPHRVTYHDSCHLNRGLGITEQPRILLNNVEDLDFVEMNNSDLCCGFGGTFAIKYGEISTAMVDEKIDLILASGAEVVTGCDVSCLMNIEGRLSRRAEDVRVMHIAEILAQE